MNFKAGDFVNTKDNKAHRAVFDSMALLSDPPQYVTQCNDGVFLTKDLELWQPTVGEWVVSPIGTDNFQCFKWFDGCKDKLAEPFIGELPSFTRR